MATLHRLLSSRVKAELFRLLFGLDAPELHLRELARRAELNEATVRQELKRLTELDLLVKRRDSNRTCYRANTAHPLYQEIHRLVLKTDGLADVLREALPARAVRAAFVFGSLADNTGEAGSDVDLMVIGDTSLRALAGGLAGAAQRIGREINPHLLTLEEFVRRRQAGDHFLTSVLAGPRLFVIGSNDELEALGG